MNRMIVRIAALSACLCGCTSEPDGVPRRDKAATAPVPTAARDTLVDDRPAAVAGDRPSPNSGPQPTLAATNFTGSTEVRDRPRRLPPTDHTSSENSVQSRSRAELADGNRELEHRTVEPVPSEWTESSRDVRPTAGFKETKSKPSAAGGSMLRAITSRLMRDNPDRPVAELPPMGPGEKLTWHLNDVDVRQALEMLSREKGLSILLAPGVTGQVTANFEQMEPAAALAAILKLCHLAAHQEDGLTFVYPLSEFPQENLQVQVFPLDYASAEQLLPTVEKLLSPSGTASVILGAPANNRRTQEAIVVTDSPATIGRVQQYIAQMDQLPRQVMIEAYLLSVDLSNDSRHGINYNHLFKLGKGRISIDVTGFATSTNSPAIFARIDGNDVGSLVELLQSTTDAKTLAAPRVMVINEQKARIQIGERLGYRVVTVTQAAAVEQVNFLEVGVVLEVTPRITRDGRVVMRVKPEVSSAKIDPETLLPTEKTTEVETDVLLNSGQGIVIGGLMQEKDIEGQSKVPFLGDLYLIGRLFQRRSTTRQRTEIVVTLVPRIVNPGDPATERDAIDGERSQTPLLDGPLLRHARPWEPQLPDAVERPTRFPFVGRHKRGCECGQEDCPYRAADLPPNSPEMQTGVQIAPQ